MKASGLPWWHSGSESACQFRGHGFNPWPRKIPHAAEQRSPYATTTEPGSATREATARRTQCTSPREELPLGANGESPCPARKTHHSQKLINWNYVKVAQSCPNLCNPMDHTVHGILQVRILEWVAFPFSKGSSQPRDWTQVSHIAGGFFTS